MLFNNLHIKKHYFEGVRVYSLNFGIFKKGAAMTIPCLGIFVSRQSLKDTDLLRHEFGHILQARKFGTLAYWRHIVPASLKSARLAHINRSHRHMGTWSEWSANQLSFNYFNQPASWDRINFPLEPPSGRTSAMPRFMVDFPGVQEESRKPENNR